VLTLSDSGAGCGPTPTPTVTPTVTPTDPMTGVTTTPTPTPTLTPTNTQTPSVTPTNTETPTNTPTSSQTPTVTPTNTVTPSITPSNTQTPSVTPTNTATPTVTPSETPTNTPTLTQTPTPTNLPFRGYIFPEPQDSTSQFDLGTYMSSFPSYTYAGFGNTGGYPAGPGYAADLNWYVQYSGWTGSNGNFITNVSTISNAIRQSSGTGTDSEGCSQNQYTFGSIGITTSMVNPNIQYVYSVWIPLAGVGENRSGYLGPFSRIGLVPQFTISIGASNTVVIKSNAHAIESECAEVVGFNEIIGCYSRIEIRIADCRITCVSF
jgi:hypothetical protein